jgi:hypothetical protein
MAGKVGRKFTGKEIASMNCWGFTPALFAGLERQLKEFFGAEGARVSRPVSASSGKTHGSGDPCSVDLKREFYLPAAVSEMIARREAEVRVLPTDSAWFGVTYREDKPRVVAAIAELVRAGKYPAKLF